MKDLNPIVFWAVFQEMLGPWLWVVIAASVVATIAFVWVVIREGRLSSRRLVWSEVAGLAGGVAALLIMMAVTNSRFADLGGPIDWLLAVSIFALGFVGSIVGVYAFLSVFAMTRAPAKSEDG